MDRLRDDKRLGKISENKKSFGGQPSSQNLIKLKSSIFYLVFFFDFKHWYKNNSIFSKLEVKSVDFSVYWIIIPKLGRLVIKVGSEWEWALPSCN